MPCCLVLPDPLTCRSQYGCSTRAVRNVRNRDSHAEATLPYWTLPQRQAFLHAAQLPVAPPSKRVTLTAAAAVEIYVLRGVHSAAALAKTVRFRLLNCLKVTL